MQRLGAVMGLEPWGQHQELPGGVVVPAAAGQACPVWGPGAAVTPATRGGAVQPGEPVPLKGPSFRDWF